LRPIKRGLARNGLVLDILALEHILKRLDGVDPLLFTTHKILAIVRIPRRKLRLEFVEAKIFQYIQGKIQATANFILNLLRRAEELAPRPMWRIHHRIAALHVLFAHPVFNLFTDGPALGMPEDLTVPSQFLNREKIELLAQHAMVALLRLLNSFQVIFEVLFRKERRSINPLQLRILFIAKPVRARNIEQLERLDFPGRRNVRPAAEIGELTSAVNRNLFVGLGELLDEVALHEVALFLELSQSLIPRHKFARIGNVLLHQFLHFLFDLFQVLGRERSRTVTVVEESRLGRRAMA